MRLELSRIPKVATALPDAAQSADLERFSFLCRIAPRGQGASYSCNVAEIDGYELRVYRRPTLT